MTMMTIDFRNAKPEIDDVLKQVVRLLRNVLPTGSFGEREKAALELSNEAVRRVIQDELQDIADSFGDFVEYQGQRYRRHQPGTGRYFSLCGDSEVTRDSYRLMGVHNGPTIIPLELEAGILENATPELARNVAHGYGQHDMRQHGELLEKAHRIPPPRATLERTAKTLAKEVIAELPRIEPKIRCLEVVPEKAQGIVLGIDRTSAPMAEPSDKKNPPRKKPYQRRAPEPVEVNYRMAYVATVTLVDEQGEALVTRRYAIEASDSEQDLLARAMADVRHALHRRINLRVAVIQDGAHEMWNLVRPELNALKDDGVIVTWYEAIDFCHLIERLGEGLELIDCESRQWQLQIWRQSLVEDDTAIDAIASYLRFHRKDAKSPEKRKKLNEHITYIENNNDRMRYRTLRQQGMPIGSGITESACKTVVNMRAKGAGQRWSVPGLRGTLQLRALNASDRFDAFWVHFAKAHVANINNCAHAA
jgi:hypothetical protein